VLTVAVSVVAGVAAITSAVPSLASHAVVMSLGCLVALTMVNLRGVKESGRAFALPTYVFVAAVYAMLLVGFGKLLFGSGLHAESADYQLKQVAHTGGLFTVFLALRAFASGCTALTGVEAVSNGVPAFTPPKSRNAATTLAVMGFLAISMFVGITILAVAAHVHMAENASDLIGFHGVQKTALSQVAIATFGTTAPFYVLNAATAAILILAANTAFNGFPVLASLLGRDEFLPHQLSHRGDRLVFSNGIVALALCSALLVWFFGGDTSRLIPLYAVGVFLSFTLSQWGMVRHHKKEREPHWKRGVVINGVGSVATAIVTIIIASTKFTEGAWVPIVVIPVIVVVFKSIKRHYASVAAGLSVPAEYRPRRMNHTVVVLVGSVHRGVLEALAYAKSLNPDRLLAVTVVSDEEEQERIEQSWSTLDIGVPLEIVHSPYRELVSPVLRFVDELDARYENSVITVVLPEFVVGSWWGQLLHNQSALLLKARLLFRKGTVVTSVPYHLEA
jgi:amino acid transporter